MAFSSMYGLPVEVFSVSALYYWCVSSQSVCALLEWYGVCEMCGVVCVGV